MSQSLQSLLSLLLLLAVSLDGLDALGPHRRLARTRRGRAGRARGEPSEREASTPRAPLVIAPSSTRVILGSEITPLPSPHARRTHSTITREINPVRDGRRRSERCRTVRGSCASSSLVPPGHTASVSPVRSFPLHKKLAPQPDHRQDDRNRHGRAYKCLARRANSKDVSGPYSTKSHSTESNHHTMAGVEGVRITGELGFSDGATFTRTHALTCHCHARPRARPRRASARKDPHPRGMQVPRDPAPLL